MSVEPSSPWVLKRKIHPSPWQKKWARGDRRVHRSSCRSSICRLLRNLNCFWTNGTSLTYSLIHSFSHTSLIPSQICPLQRRLCIKTAKSKLDSLDKEEESSEKEREREADNFWHESHKTLRGEQIINSNSTKKMAAATLLQLTRPFSAFPTQKICMYVYTYDSVLTGWKRKKYVMRKWVFAPLAIASRSPRAPWKM